MKKTYKNTLPKNMEVKSTNVRIENREIFVDVEFQEKFEPKDGDFLVTNIGCIFIYNTKYNLRFLKGFYVGINADDEIVISDKTSGFSGVERYATEQEKIDFLSRLEKECHKKWNEETKQLEDIRWRANLGEKYWYIADTSVLEDNELAANDDDVRYKNKNYFRTSEAAQKVADQIKDIFKNSKAE